jgi:hypothetical protein
LPVGFPAGVAFGIRRDEEFNRLLEDEVMMRHLFLGLLFILAGCAQADSRPEFARTPPVSWAELDLVELNGRLEKAVLSDEGWPSNPLQSTLQLFGDDTEAQAVVVEEMKNRVEGADSVTVVMIRDGFLDDSVRGDWHEVVFERQTDGTWRVVEARVAYRCRRGENTSVYQSEFCH